MQNIELFPEDNGPQLFRRFHEDVALRHGPRVKQITIEARTLNVDLESHPLTLDDALMLRRTALILPLLCNLTRLHLDILPATAGDFEYEPMLDVLDRVAYPVLQWLALTAYCTRPMDPIRLAQTLPRFTTVRHLSIAGVAWTHGPELANAIASLPLTGLRLDDVDGPILRHLAQIAEDDHHLLVTHLAIVACPSTNLLDLHRLFLAISNTLAHLKLEYLEELAPSTHARLIFPSFLKSFIFRAPSPYASIILSYFHLCPFAEFRVLGTLEDPGWSYLSDMLLRLRFRENPPRKRICVEVQSEKERQGFESLRPDLTAANVCFEVVSR